MAVSDKNTDLDPKANTDAVQAGEEEFSSKTEMPDEVVAMPDDLRGMSDDELTALRKRMVRKMDCVIM